MKYFNILIFGLLIMFSSCGDNVIEDPDENIFGYEYFPVDVGYTWEYQVDSIRIIQSGSNNVVSTSFIQERITDLISDSNGEKTYRMERSYRSDMDSEWQLQDVWQIAMTDEQATRTEENLRFIKLVFPAVQNTRWDGNVHFDSEKEYAVGADFLAVYRGWQYKIEDVGVSRNVGGIDYDEVLHVSHINEQSFIDRRLSEEFYAKDIGLIQRKMEIFDTQNGNTSIPWVDRAEEGFQLNQSLLSFSKN